MKRIFFSEILKRTNQKRENPTLLATKERRGLICGCPKPTTIKLMTNKSTEINLRLGVAELPLKSKEELQLMKDSLKKEKVPDPFHCRY